jgi:hypothetical protein
MRLTSEYTGIKAGSSVDKQNFAWLIDWQFFLWNLIAGTLSSSAGITSVDSDTESIISREAWHSAALS